MEGMGKEDIWGEVEKDSEISEKEGKGKKDGRGGMKKGIWGKKGGEGKGE